MSPESLPSSSLRKSSHFKSSKLEDEISPERRTVIITQEQQHQTLNSTTQSRDVLLQWGQRKRSRCSRTESRSMANSNSNSSEKHHVIQMPPPSSSVASTSRVRPNGLLHSKDTHGFSVSKNRNPAAAEKMGCTNGTSPSRNGVGVSRTIARSSIGKRSPLKKVKSDDSLVNGNHQHDHHDDHDGHAHIELSEHEINNNGVHHSCSPAEWPRIYISLSRKEKEDDFYAMKGTKLPHRPKKRPKLVDRALQYCFPGLWLSDLTRARYEVRERKSAKKPKRRGLKGLENMESESE